MLTLHKSNMHKSTMNVVDLFAGVRGFGRGFESEGFDVIIAVEDFKPVAETYKELF